MSAVYRLDQDSLKKDKQLRNKLAQLFLKLDKDHMQKYGQQPYQSLQQQRKALQHYARWLRNTKNLSVFTDNQKDPKGFLSLYPSKRMRNAAILGNFYIQPQLRGHGLGSSMLQMAQQQAKKQKIKNLLITWNAKNSGAQKLYASKGFQPLSITGLKKI